MNKLFTTFLSIAILCLFPGAALAVSLSGYSEGWDVSGDLAGWSPNTIVSNIAVVDTGGNPNGYLYTYGDGQSSFDVGALSQLPEITGDYSGNLWTVSADLSFISGNFDDVWLRFRYLDSSQNGWVIPLTNSFTLGGWTSVSVTFDPSWSDAQALANGWLTDQDISPGALPSVAWSQNMSDVYTTEIRFSGEGPLEAGIDNFQLNAVAVPEPASILLLGTGLAGMALFRRRFRA